MAVDFSPEAIKWVDNVNAAAATSAGWRLEILGKRFRKPVKNQQGELEYPNSPLRIRRFVKGLPWVLVHDAVRYLISQSPYEGIIYNGIKIPGKYRPTMTRWTRDDQERVDGQAAGSYTLVQDLIEDGVTDEFHTPSGGSCSEEVVTEWRWDDPDVVDATTLEGFGQQGITYSIQAVRRDDNGGFEYAIVKRVSKTQFSGWRTTECNEFETVETATWDNVYGGLGGAPFDVGAGEAIPEACDNSQGTTISLNVSENSDCTFKIVAQRRTSKSADGSAKSSTKTIFEHTEETSDTAKSAPAGTAHTPSSSKGEYYSHESKLRPDGRYDTTRKTVTEKQVDGARKTVKKTLRGVVTTVTDRNTTSNATTVSKVGDEVTIEKTPSGRWNRTVTKVAATTAGTVAANCETTVFSHQHSSTKNVASKPSEEAPDAGSGKTHSVTARQTEEGTWDVTSTTTTELKGTARKSKRKTLRGVVETTVERNTSTSDVSVADIGDEVIVEQTPGGLWNRTTTKVAATAVGAIGQECQQTVFEHQHATTTNQKTTPSSDVSAARSGTVHSRVARRTEEGTWDVQDRTTTELSRSNARVTQRRTLHGTVTVRYDRNVSSPGQLPASAGSSVSSEVTPGGLYNVETTRFTASGGTIGQGGTRSRHETQRTTIKVQSTPGGEPTTPSQNQVNTVVSRQQDDGTWEVETRDVNHFPATAQGQTRWATETSTTTVTRHATQVNPTGSGQYWEASSEPDDEGAATTRVTTYDPIGKKVGPITWRSVIKSPNSTMTYECGLVVFCNQNVVPDIPGGNVSVSVHYNKFGLLDGQVKWENLVSWVKNDNNSNSTDGSQKGSITSYQFTVDAVGRTWKRTVTAPTIAYYGSGNEGSEADARANAKFVSGVSLPPRTYITGMPSFGTWTLES